MKNIFKIAGLIVVAALFQSCSTTFMASAPYDEVYETRPAYAPSSASVTQAPGANEQYYSPETRQTTPQGTDYRDYSAAQQKYSGNYQQDYQQGQQQEVISDPDRSVSYYDNDNFDYDDYYDYSYAVRIKRFHRPVYGFGYYDDCYTNLYWYTYDPWVWGTSIYLGYDWWWWDWYGGPYFSIGYNWGWGSIGWHWGFPFSGWYYYPHFFYRYPWSPWYWGYSGWGYWAGYNHGWWDGYWFGSYYNSFDKNSYYYGPRRSRGESFGSGGGTFGDYYQKTVNQRRNASSGETRIPDVNVSDPGTTGQTLTQRRINASQGNNVAAGQDVKAVSSDNLTARRINAGNEASQDVEVRQDVGRTNTSRVMPSGNAQNQRYSEQPANENTSARRINSSNTNAPATVTSSQQDDRQMHHPESSAQLQEQNGSNIRSNDRRIIESGSTIVGGERVRISQGESRETVINPQTETRSERYNQTQERYSYPQTRQQPPVQSYDYSRYRRQQPEVSREELAKPRTQTPQQEGQVRTYTPPAYTQPKRSDVYSTPRNNPVPSQYNYQRPAQESAPSSPQPTQPQRRYNVPATPQPQYKAPSQEGSRRSYVPPAGSSPRRESYRSSESSYTPRSSSPSYSPSIPSYSAPARSSSSGSSSPSSAGRRR